MQMQFSQISAHAAPPAPNARIWRRSDWEETIDLPFGRVRHPSAPWVSRKRGQRYLFAVRAEMDLSTAGGTTLVGLHEAENLENTIMKMIALVSALSLAAFSVACGGSTPESETPESAGVDEFPAAEEAPLSEDPAMDPAMDPATDPATDPAAIEGTEPAAEEGIEEPAAAEEGTEEAAE